MQRLRSVQLTGRRSLGARAALGGSFAVAVIVGLVVLLDSSGERTSKPFHPGYPESIVLDSDNHGAVLITEKGIEGVAADGSVRWTRRIGPSDLLAFAVCTTTCPAAQLSFAQSGSSPPERPDGPISVYSARGDVESFDGPPLRVDRPLLPGPKPLRLALDRVGESPKLLGAGPPIAVRSTDLFAITNPARDRALIVEFGSRGQTTPKVLELKSEGKGWVLASRIEAPRAFRDICLSSVNDRVGLVGNGPALLSGGDSGFVQVPGGRPAEERAELCALSATSFATAVARTTGKGSETLLAVHRGARVDYARLVGSAASQIWVSAKTGAVAVLMGHSITIVDPNRKARRRWTDVAAATLADANHLRVFDPQNRSRVRGF